MLSPVAFGIPNSRPRFYLLAKRDENRVAHAIASTLPDVPSRPPSTINDYLDESDVIDSRLWLSEETFARHGLGLDIVDRDSVRSACFTKSYATFANGTGSVLATQVSAIRSPSMLFHLPAEREFGGVSSHATSRFCRTTHATAFLVETAIFLSARNGSSPDIPLRVQFVFPLRSTLTDCSYLMRAFFAAWPKSVTEKQVYRALGNSVCVRVVGELLRFLHAQ